MSVEFLFLIAFILLLVEMVVPALGIFGVASFIAFITGLVGMVLQGREDFYGLSFEMVTAIGITTFIIFAATVYFVYKAIGKKNQTGVEAMIGQTVTVKSWKGQSGLITYEGEDWRAKSDDKLVSGDMVRITKYNNLTLTVEKES